MLVAAQKGSQLIKPYRRPPMNENSALKWLVILFLGTMTIVLTFVAVVIWKFSPIIKVDEDNDKVEMLGGLVEVDGIEESIRLGTKILEKGDFDWVEKKENFTVDRSKHKVIKVEFANGKFEFNTSSDDTLRIECETFGENSITPKVSVETIYVDLTDTAVAKCDIEVPKDMKVEVDGSNGKIEIERPLFSFAAEMANGRFEFEADSSAKYRFQTSIVNGRVDKFESSDDPRAYQIVMKLVNGRIKVDKCYGSGCD
jgi:hypothetical protein